MASRRLADRPHPDRYRRQAKELLKALGRAEPAAIERLRAHHPRADQSAAAPKLADAQLLLAREHGFSSWPLFIAAIRASEAPPSFPDSLACDRGPLGIEVARSDGAAGVVLFVLAGNVGRRHLGIRQVADRLQRAGYCTVLADLLTDEEAIEDAIHEELRFDIPLLKARPALALDWIGREPRLSGLPLALYCSSTGGAAGVALAADHPEQVRAMICAAGRPDLSGSSAWRVRMPSLFIVGGEDAVALGFTRLMLEIFPRDIASRLEIVQGVGLRFDEGPAAARAAELSIGWLAKLLAPQAAVTGEAA